MRVLYPPMKRLLPLLRAAALALAFSGASSASAQTVVTIGAGTAVAPGEETRTATFSSVVQDTDLLNYTENGLVVSATGGAYQSFDPTGGSGLGGFSGGFHYDSGGSERAVQLRTTDAAKLFGIEFNVGNGYGSPTTHFRYNALKGEVSVGTGVLSVASGSVLGFKLAEGFDELRIGAYSTETEAQSAGDFSFQAIALDNLRVRTTAFEGSASAVPEPASLMLMLPGLAVVGALRRRQRPRGEASAEPEL